MYRRSARFYDLVHRDVPYGAQADALLQLIEAPLPHARTLLDVGCGTGRHLELLRERYRVQGLDASAELLAIARERLPDVQLHRGDIRTFELGRRFDVVTCLFAAIGYARTKAGLRAALTHLASHVAVTGLVMVEPWLAPPAPWHFAEAFADDPRRLLARIGRGWTEGGLWVSETDYLVVENGDAEHFRERHELGLFDETDYDGAFRAAGLAVDRTDAYGASGLFLGTPS